MSAIRSMGAPGAAFPPAPTTATAKASAGVGLEVAAAGALAFLTLVAVPGTRGIVGPAPSLLAVMVAALAMHLLAWVCRRRLGSAGFLVALAGSPILAAWLALPHTTFLGVTWTGTWRAGTDGVRRALEALGTGLPPGLDEPEALGQGRLALAVLFVAVCALMADQAAFRMRRASLALLPSFTLVLLGATRAPSDQRDRAIAAYLIVAMAFLLVHHTMAIRDATVTVSGRAPFRLARLAPAGAALAAVAVVTALVVGPRLPGYGRPPIVAAAGSVLAQQGAGVQLSSLVDLNPTLTERSNLVMFTVSSPVAAYWRLTSLDAFDGRVWRQGPGHGSAAAALTAGYVPGVAADQDFEIEGLRSEWLPAAYRPQRVEGAGGYLVTGDSSTVRQREAARFGQRYQVASLIPRLTPFQLQGLPVPPPGPALRRYLALPADLPRRVATEADRVTRSARFRGPYATALALQTYFRDGFTYDLQVGPSHSEDALMRFLFQTRRGYCEQFAASFAVMARAVGLPARVAVGFTPGERGPDDRYQVRGLNAHAWPEVYLEGAGWVAFEPTPGRGMPGAEAYTGVARAQASFRQGDPTFPGPVSTSPTTATTAVPGTSATTGPTGPSSVPTTGTTGVTPVPPRAAARPGQFPVVPMVAAGVAVLLAAGVPSAKRARRRSRRRQAVDPNDRVMVAWTEAAEALAASGMGRRPSETLLDHAARAADDYRLPERLAEPVLALAGRAGTASYSGRQVGADDAAQSALTAAAIEAALRGVTPLPRRVGHALDPRPLWRRQRRPTPGHPELRSGEESQGACDE